MIDFCREIGVFVANPHVNNVEGGGRYRADNVQLLAKQRYDPKGLLNPGKMVTFHPESATAGAKTMKTWIPDARNFAYLNWKQVDALPRESTLLVLPTAAIEQHGHHLPLATDTLINNLLLGHALEKLPAELPVYALPPVHYGKSNEHIGFPGTLSVSASTFMAVLARSGLQLVQRRLPETRSLQHPRRQYFAHRRDGPRPARRIRPANFCAARLGRNFVRGPRPAGARLRIPRGRSGNRFSSGLRAGTGGPLRLHRPITSRTSPSRRCCCPENAPATFAWLTRDIAPSGVHGRSASGHTRKMARAGWSKRPRGWPLRSKR